MKGSIAAELFVLRKRASTWILLAIWLVLGMFFNYLLPYLTYRNNAGSPTQPPLTPLLPQGLIGTLVNAFPFYGGAIVLMLGALSLGSEYGWDTLKTLFTQRPRRLRLFAAKLIAAGIALVPFVLLLYACGAIASDVIARLEGAPVAWPAAGLILRAVLAGWFILAVWTAFGVLLAALSRGTALAIGVGMLYALVVEGLLSAFASDLSFLQPVVKLFLRANAYSLVKPLGASLSAGGPGAFAGPFVGGTLAFVVLALYLTAFVALAALVLHRRDVV